MGPNPSLVWDGEDHAALQLFVRHKTIMKYLKYPIALLIITAICSVLSAVKADEQPTDAIKIFHEYFEANRNMDWTRAAQYISPDSLEGFKQKNLSILFRTEEKGQQEIVKEFGVQNLAALESLSPSEFYAAVMRRRWSALKDKQTDYLRNAKTSILSTDAINKNRVMVKYKTDVNFKGKSISKTGEYLLVKQGTDWKIDIMNSGTLTKNNKKE